MYIHAYMYVYLYTYMYACIYVYVYVSALYVTTWGEKTWENERQGHCQTEIEKHYFTLSWCVWSEYRSSQLLYEPESKEGSLHEYQEK